MAEKKPLCIYTGEIKELQAGDTLPVAPADIAGITHSATAKTTPVDADELPLVDSAASNVLKKLTWANLKATLKTYFDGLYAVITHTANADGFSESGGTTSRTLTVSGGNVGLVGGGVNQNFVALGANETCATIQAVGYTTSALKYPMEAGSTYRYKIYVWFSSVVYTTGIYFAVNGTTTPRDLIMDYQAPLGKNVAKDIPVQQRAYLTGIVTTSTGAVADNGLGWYVEISGFIKNNVTGINTFGLTFASEVAGSTVSTLAGSYAEFTRTL